MAACPSRVARGQARWTAGHHHVGGGHVGVPVAEPEPLGGPRPPDRRSGRPPVGNQGGGRVRAVAPGVHRPPRPPPSPGTPTAHSSPVSPAADRAAGQHRKADRAPARTVRPAIDRSSNPGPSETTKPGEAGVGHQQVGAPPDAPAPEPAGRRGARPPPPARASSSGSTKRAAGPPDPVGGEGAEGMVAADPGARAPAQRGQVVGAGAHRLAHQLGSAISSSGREVRSPAPRVRQRSPGLEEAATVRRSSARPGA